MKIKLLAIFAALVIICTAAIAMAHDVHVNGYTRADGTYVQPYERTAPNSTVNDNYSTSGNVNPYTGTAGTKPRDDGSTLGGGSSYGNPYATQQQPANTGMYGTSTGNSLYGR